MTVLVSYFEKPSQDESTDDCQQIGLKLERSFLKYVAVDSVFGRLIIHLGSQRYVKKFSISEGC